jgi:hypothetical protein
MRILLLLLCSFAASMQAQQDPRDLLVGVRNRVMQTVDRLPRYMCTQTIDRAQYEPTGGRRTSSCDDLAAQKKTAQGRLRLSASDRLRLDVAVAATDEIYSWVGEDRFDDRSLFDLVRQGSLQTGSFRTFLSSIFGSDAASFSYNGDTTVNGRPLVEFGFRVPLEKSNYVFGNRRQEVKTGYEGSLLVDPKTFDLARLIVTTSQLPTEVGSCQATTTMDYARVRLNEADFLLPTEAQLNILGIDGTEKQNRTVYSACHEFLGKSKLTFDEPAPGPGDLAAGGVSTNRPFVLPPGRQFTVAFTQSIDTATAAAGDPVRAKLTTAIRDDSSKVVVPAGAAVTVRIVKLQHFYGASSASVTLGVKLESVDVGGTPQPLAAALDRTSQRFAKDNSGKAGGLGQRVELGSLDALEDRAAGVFEFRDAKANYVVKDGLESTWVTMAP